MFYKRSKHEANFKLENQHKKTHLRPKREAKCSKHVLIFLLSRYDWLWSGIWKQTTTAIYFASCFLWKLIRSSQIIHLPHWHAIIWFCNKISAFSILLVNFSSWYYFLFIKFLVVKYQVLSSIFTGFIFTLKISK